MAGLRVIKVPDVGEGIAEVELVAWHVAPGDVVAEDQALADVMTDKASVEIPSSVAGRVVALGGEVGQMLAVGSELIRIEVEAGVAAPVPARKAPAVGPPPPVAAAPPAAVDDRAPVVARVAAALPADEAAPPRAERPIASPSVRRRAWELGIDLKGVAPSGTAGRITQADLDAAAAARG
ncbi:MAG: E3 binding domain-containing protein, partial [Aquincola sp.]|nr:E3 binding domain-containing protein [Aquincola sp.]